MSEKIMEDGNVAYLTESKNWYARRMPDKDNWTSIDYYTLEGKYIKLPNGTCPNCKEHIQSKHCGDFVRCSCGECFVDTDRWCPERGRFGGNIIIN
jgi:ribosomal protein S27AE